MFWHNHGGRAARRALTALLTLATGLLIALGTGTPAMAGADTFCAKSIPANNVCAGPSHTLTASRGWNQTSGAGCAGAVAYGQYYCAAPAGCHAYSGTVIRTPAIRHRSTTAKNMTGYSTWGSTPEPSYCDPGSPYRVNGPLSSRAAEPAGVPALDRGAEQAPAAVAKIWPTADTSTARRFSTPRGDGWIVPLPGDRKLCVAVDDGGTGYGYSCQSYGDARSLGAIVTLEDADTGSAKGDLAVAVVAEGSEGLTVTDRAGGKRTVAPVGGVVAVSLGAGDAAVALDAGDDVTATRAQRWSVGRR